MNDDLWEIIECAKQIHAYLNERNPIHLERNIINAKVLAKDIRKRGEKIRNEDE